MFNQNQRTLKDGCFILSAQVVISDGGPSPRQSSVLVMVQVLDENDNKPTFHEKVYKVKLPERERRKKAEPIYRVFAYDLDEGPNSDISYSIVDGNDDGKFVIDPKTGTVLSRKACPAGGYDILTVRDDQYGRSFGTKKVFFGSTQNSISVYCLKNIYILFEVITNLPGEPFQVRPFVDTNE